MKTIKLLRLAALVVMGTILAGCAKELDVNPVAEDNIVVCTTTVTLDPDDSKALSIVGDKGVKTFAEGEQVALRYYIYRTKWDKAISQPLSKTDISADGKTATLTFSLTNPEPNYQISFYYPASMAKYENATGAVDYTQIILQNGTLASLSANLDLAIFSGKMSGTNLPANVTLTNQLAILAITLKNIDGSSDITSTITGLTLSDGTNTYSISRSVAAGPIYVAIQPVSNKNITITATSGSNSYTKSLTGKTYAAGNGYNVSWRMESAPTLKLTSPSVGQVIGSDGINYAYNATRPSGVTAVAMIAYLSGDHGLSIAMADENSSKSIHWIPAMAAAAAHTPAFSGGTWKIPSREDWRNMFYSFGKNYTNYSGLNNALTNVGGTALPVRYYWTSDEKNTSTVYFVHFNEDGSVESNGTGKENNTDYARSCLAF